MQISYNVHRNHHVICMQESHTGNNYFRCRATKNQTKNREILDSAGNFKRKCVALSKRRGMLFPISRISISDFHGERNVVDRGEQ